MRSVRRSSIKRPGRGAEWPRWISWVCREGGVFYQPAGVTSLVASLGVGLVFRSCLIEGRQFGKRGVGRHELRERIERHPEPARVVHLRREVNVRERNV